MKAVQHLEALKRDRRHGSTSLALMVLEAYRSLAVEGEDLEREVETFAAEVSKARPAMPLINRFSQEVLKRYYPHTREGLLKACEAVEKAYREIQTSLIEKALTVLEDVGSVATISHSNTVIQILRKADSVRRVYILESRPLREGLLTYTELADVKDVVVVVDAAAGYAVEEADAVVVGADAVFPDGSFSGKVGVKTLALHSQFSGKPFYTACDTWKFSEKFENEYGPAEDVAGGGVRVYNPVFERVGPGHVTSYLTEKGSVRPGDVLSCAG